MKFTFFVLAIMFPLVFSQGSGGSGGGGGGGGDTYASGDTGGGSCSTDCLIAFGVIAGIALLCLCTCYICKYLARWKVGNESLSLPLPEGVAKTSKTPKDCVSFSPDLWKANYVEKGITKNWKPNLTISETGNISGKGEDEGETGKQNFSISGKWNAETGRIFFEKAYTDPSYVIEYTGYACDDVGQFTFKGQWVSRNNPSYKGSFSIFYGVSSQV